MTSVHTILLILISGNAHTVQILKLIIRIKCDKYFTRLIINLNYGFVILIIETKDSIVVRLKLKESVNIYFGKEKEKKHLKRVRFYILFFFSRNHLNSHNVNDALKVLQE